MLAARSNKLERPHERIGDKMKTIIETYVRGILDLIALSRKEPDYSIIDEIIEEKKEEETE